MKESSILVINVVIDLRYRDQKDETNIQYVTTGADSNVNTSDEVVKKSSPAITEAKESGSGSEPKELNKTELQETGDLSEKTVNEFRVLQIPAVVCSNKLPERIRLTDEVLRKIRDCLWSSPSEPPEILTPSRLCYIMKKGDTFEDVIEKLLRETEIGVSAQLETREGIRKGTLSLLSIS